MKPNDLHGYDESLNNVSEKLENSELKVKRTNSGAIDIDFYFHQAKELRRKEIATWTTVAHIRFRESLKLVVISANRCWAELTERKRHSIWQHLHQEKSSK